MNILLENKRANELAYERCLNATRMTNLRNCAAPEEEQEGGRSILKSGCVTCGPLPILGTQGLIPSLPIQAGSVSINTFNLYDPSVMVNVNLLINTPISILSSLTFRLVKSINGASQPVGGSYTFSDPIEALSSNSFNFSFNDTSSGYGYITYSVEVISATLLQAGTTIGGTISALAVESFH